MAFDLEELYRTTYDAVVRFLYRKVWDADRAEDLAQEVFMRALHHQPEKPRSWVFAVAANIARDEARSAIRRRKHLTLLTHEPIASPSPLSDVHEDLEQEEREAEVKRALVAGAGAAMLLPQRVPQAIALEMLLTGDPITAARAAELGLVNRVTPKGGALDGALELAASIAANGPLAVAITKQIAREGGDWTFEEGWEKQGALMAPVFGSEDAQERGG